MATNTMVEIPLRSLMASSKNNAELVIVLCDMGLQALAERDAAREELRSSWREGVDDAINVLRGGAIGVALNGEEEWSRERSEYLRGVREELATLKAAQPESAPVVGGVTEDLIDAICDSIQPPHRALGLLVQLRKEIRATKRVDMEKVAEAIHQHFMRRSHGSIYESALHVLRAIGDEPAAEAPASVPKSEAKLFHGIPVYVDPACPPNKLYFAAGPLDGPTGPNSFAAIVDIKPASPAPEPATVGPFTADGRTGIREGDHVVTWTSTKNGNRERLVRLLNAGLEAEQLRARVAELERDRDGWKLDAQLRARNEGVQKDRADAAEKDAEQHGKRCLDIWKTCRKELSVEPEEVLYAEQAVAAVIARMKDAEAKLAALGENPIQRELVERHRHVSLFRRTVETLDSILAGREPGVAS